MALGVNVLAARIKVNVFCCFNVTIDRRRGLRRPVLGFSMHRVPARGPPRRTCPLPLFLLEKDSVMSLDASAAGTYSRCRPQLCCENATEKNQVVRLSQICNKTGRCRLPKGGGGPPRYPYRLRYSVISQDSKDRLQFRSVMSRATDTFAIERLPDLHFDLHFAECENSRPGAGRSAGRRGHR